jgi:hypothetical protein
MEKTKDPQKKKEEEEEEIELNPWHPKVKPNES